MKRYQTPKSEIIMLYPEAPLAASPGEASQNIRINDSKNASQDFEALSNKKIWGN